jgi:hypothetical protein
LENSNYTIRKQNYSSPTIKYEVVMFVSQKFIAAIKLSSEPAYKIAWSAGVNPTMLRKLMNGIEKPKLNDARIIAVGEAVGLSAAECFQEAGA